MTNALVISLSIVVLLSAAAGLILVRRQRRASRPQACRQNDDRPLRSIVLLLSKPRFPDIPRLEEAVERAWKMKLPKDQPEPREFVAGKPDLPSAVVVAQGKTVLVNYIPVPYFDDPEKLKEDLGELRAREMIEQHKAWLSVDLLGEIPENMTETDLYRELGKLAAELAGNDTLGFCLPQFGRLFPYTTEALQALTGAGDIVEGLIQASPAPVVQIDGDDPRMQAAVEQARSTLPEFLRLFEVRKRGDTFAVKFPLTSGEHTEFIWMLVDIIEGNRAVGRLDNDPANLPGYVAGQSVNVRLDDIVDWVATVDDELHGGFSIKAIGEIQKDPG